MASTRSSTPHIVLLPYPAQGHIPPLLTLSKQLAARGALVTLVNIESINKRLQLHAWPPNIRLQGLRFPYDIPYGYDASCHLEHEKFGVALVEAQKAFEELLQNMLQEEGLPRVSCIVADFFWGWHLESANKFQITGASFWSGSSNWGVVHYNLPLLISAGDAPYVKDSAEKTIDYVPGLAPMKLSDFPYYATVEFATMLEYLMEAQRQTLSCMDKDSWILLNSTEELEPASFDAMQRIHGSRCIGVGPLFPLNPPPGAFHGLRDESQESITWLNTQAPLSVLYISFGSIATLSDEQLRALSTALLESRRPFLWVLRAELEDQVLREVFQGEFNGMIVPWAPQLHVLAHGSVGGFLSHCGWNSVFESVANGVPILCWPCEVEQNLNSRLVVEDLKAGIRVEQCVPEKIKEAIDLVMKKDSVERSNAQQIKRDVARAVAEDGCSYKSLSRFLQDTV